MEVVSFKIRNRMLADFMKQQPGYLRGFHAINWRWTTVVLDGTIALRCLVAVLVRRRKKENSLANYSEKAATGPFLGV